MRLAAGFHGLFQIQQRPIPWERPIGAAISMGSPLLVGLLLGRVGDGMIALFGGFAWLYLFREPYPVRGRKLAVVATGLAIAHLAGALSASLSVWAAAVVLGLVGVLSYVLAEAFGAPVPGAFFFVFACAVATGLPATPAVALGRAGLVLLGGVPAWVLAMVGWLWDPHGPERAVVATVYRALGALLAAVGTEQFHAAQHQATLALGTAERALPAEATRWRRPGEFERLAHLTAQAEALYLAIGERGTLGQPVDARLPGLLRALADAVADPERAACLVIPPAGAAMDPESGAARVRASGPESVAASRSGGARSSDPPEGLLEERLRLAVAIAAATAELPRDPAPQPEQSASGSRLAGVLDRRSAVLPRALRIGLMLVLSHLIAYGVGAHTPYWVPVSCMAVMAGVTAVTTLRRSLQRVLGTILGALLGLLLLQLQPAGLALVLLLMLLQFLTEWVILHNYAFAIALATPLAFMMAEVGHPGLPAQYLVTTRLFDICLGTALGLAGTLLIRRRPSNRRLLIVLGDALRLAAAVTRTGGRPNRLRLRRALITLRVVHDDLLRELVPVESLWPAVVAVQRVGLLLLALADQERLLPESRAQVAAFLDLCAEAVAASRQPGLERLPQAPEYPLLREALTGLHEAIDWSNRSSPGPSG